jgi:protein gp37
MGQNSAIQWTDHTFNPWWGCVKVSPACDHCYAESFAKRTGHAVWGKDAPRRFFGEKHWQEPTRWNRAAEKAGTRARVFCASMADVFEQHPDLDAPRASLWPLIEQTPMLDWLLLTKRPQNIAKMVPSQWLTQPRANVWYGTTVESNGYIWRAEHLANVPAAARFISYEPAIGPLNVHLLPMGIDWLIAGGESGAGARPPQIEWFRDVRDGCAFEGIAFFFKQWGGFNAKANGRELDGRTWDEIPLPLGVDGGARPASEHDHTGNV